MGSIPSHLRHIPGDHALETNCFLPSFAQVRIEVGENAQSAGRPTISNYRKISHGPISCSIRLTTNFIERLIFSVAGLFMI